MLDADTRLLFSHLGEHGVKRKRVISGMVEGDDEAYRKRAEPELFHGKCLGMLIGGGANGQKGV